MTIEKLFGREIEHSQIGHSQVKHNQATHTPQQRGEPGLSLYYNLNLLQRIYYFVSFLLGHVVYMQQNKKIFVLSRDELRSFLLRHAEEAALPEGKRRAQALDIEDIVLGLKQFLLHFNSCKRKKNKETGPLDLQKKASIRLYISLFHSIPVEDPSSKKGGIRIPPPNAQIFKPLPRNQNTPDQIISFAREFRERLQKKDSQTTKIYTMKKNRYSYSFQKLALALFASSNMQRFGWQDHPKKTAFQDDMNYIRHHLGNKVSLLEQLQLYDVIASETILPDDMKELAENKALQEEQLNQLKASYKASDTAEKAILRGYVNREKARAEDEENALALLFFGKVSSFIGL